MTDLGVLAEVALLLAVPVIPLIAGAMLRRRFAPHADGTPLTAAQKFGRVAGTVLLWGGVAAVLMIIVFVLNFKGKI